MTVTIPNWIGKFPVPEDKGTTMHLLLTISELIDVECPIIDHRKLTDPEFVIKICEVVNGWAVDHESPEPKSGIWVGFPETPIGRLNASLTGRIWAYYQMKEDKK